MKLFSSIFGCIFVALALTAGVANAGCTGSENACYTANNEWECRNSGCDWRDAEPPLENDSIYVKNDCNSHGSIYAAIHYLDLNDDWQTAGFYDLSYGELAGPFPTKNTKFYIHAYAKNGDFKWDGNWGPWQLYGRNYKFSEAIIRTDEWGDWVQRFTCP
jgi:hypothetical protein